jgi:hypothetical protein
VTGLVNPSFVNTSIYYGTFQLAITIFVKCLAAAIGPSLVRLNYRFIERVTSACSIKDIMWWLCWKAIFTFTSEVLDF